MFPGFFITFVSSLLLFPRNISKEESFTFSCLLEHLPQEAGECQYLVSGLIQNIPLPWYQS